MIDCSCAITAAVASASASAACVAECAVAAASCRSSRASSAPSTWRRMRARTLGHVRAATEVLGRHHCGRAQRGAALAI